jgi:cell division protein FtsL
VCVLIITVFGVAGVQAYVAQEGLRVAELERQVHKEEERLTLLRAKQAQLAAPSRIADEAAKLGLVTDANPTYLRGHFPEPSSQTSGDLRAARTLLKRSRP